jgi:hypothetical protein
MQAVLLLGGSGSGDGVYLRMRQYRGDMQRDGVWGVAMRVVRLEVEQRVCATILGRVLSDASGVLSVEENR